MNKAKDNLLYLAIALGVVAITMGPLIYAISRGNEIPEFSPKPIWTLVSTLAFVAYIVSRLTRQQLKMLQIKLGIAFATALHIVLTVAILRMITQLPVLLLGIGIFAEAHVVLYVVDRIPARKSETTKSAKSGTGPFS